MITGVPDHRILEDTAIGWMNLAWESAINEAGRFQETEYLYDSIKAEHGETVSEHAIAKHWQAKQLTLNNAFSLLQQSLEIALKARIAEISPFLLIAGDPRSWPKPKDGSTNIDFSNFRTIDAVQLCGAVNAVSALPLSRDFIEFYDRLRQSRNKIAHLDGSAIKIEVHTLLADIMTAQQYLFPRIPWTKFRFDYLMSTEQFCDKDDLFSGDDYTTDAMIYEINAALNSLTGDQLKELLAYDLTKATYRCPHCLASRSQSDDECEFVQFSNDSGLMQCIACWASYTVDEYKTAIIDYFGYLDATEQDTIRRELENLR